MVVRPLLSTGEAVLQSTLACALWPSNPSPGTLSQGPKGHVEGCSSGLCSRWGGARGSPASIWGNEDVRVSPESRVAVRNNTQVGTEPQERTSSPELKGRHKTRARSSASTAHVNKTQPRSPSYKYVCMFKGTLQRCCPCMRERTGWN